MIDPKQLQLGNIVRVKGLWDGVVDSIHENMVSFKNVDGGFCPIINISPKRIDDDVFRSFKFECIETPKVSIMDVEYVNKVWVFEDWLKIEKEDQDIDAELTYDVGEDLFDVFVYGHYVTAIEHVHDLQNLYFSLRKMELPYEKV